MRHSINALFLGSVGLLTLACSSDRGPTTPDITPIPVNTLVFTRANQSTVAFPASARLYVWCGAWEPGLINTPTVHVLFGGPGPNDPFWQLSAVVADIRLGQPMTFPNDFVFDQPKNADIFVSDQANELSTQASASGGSITFTNVSCSNGAVVEFSASAVIGSEFANGPAVSMNGQFRGYVGSPPQ